MHFPNYREFYQKELVPINMEDQSVLGHHPDVTHWLIALEGERTSSKKEFYSWKILVYATSQDGSFEHHNPHFISTSFDCFHNAYDRANDIERMCRNEGFTSRLTKEQIS